MQERPGKEKGGESSAVHSVAHCQALILRAWHAPDRGRSWERRELKQMLKAHDRSLAKHGVPRWDEILRTVPGRTVWGCMHRVQIRNAQQNTGEEKGKKEA